ncbi:hypothetical protein L535_0126 [Bordetella bronchiseptica SBL-F6116]|uniref:hypothetical protein n=1 Tax=Bordetella bronchiseptica TaxID=518 RepID=UPI00045A4FB2|nr:hypothetical protein [Bordetella bronchiseptica]KCV35926.1 hypothetical protein L489_0161 [Bordetella bronchiseptica 00-P-2730]KDD99265.1 hypothetical protein L535_0126 [Bordetella bronchiseptica SBL-F6116]
MKSLAIAAIALISQTATAGLITIGETQAFKFGREPNTGLLAIADSTGSLLVPIDARINFYPQGAFELAGKSYLVAYDVATNVPAGRRLARGAESNDIYEVSARDRNAVLTRVATLAGGIDVKIHTSDVGDSKLVCTLNACTKISPGEKAISLEDKPLPDGMDLVELSENKALLQRTYNDQLEPQIPENEPIFFVCDVGAAKSACTSVPADTIPYALQADGTYSTATDPERLTKFDYDRLGVANYHEPNLEGRIVWSNVYYLNGLSALAKMPISPALKKETETRLRSEFTALAAIAARVYPGLKVRRYSMDREPIDLLLHFSRVAQSAQHARFVIGDPLADEVLKPLIDEIRNPIRSVEEIGDGELRLRKYVPVWSDGINVPWNYQSAWIEALCLTESLNPHAALVATMLKNMGEHEKFGESTEKWGYGGGQFYEGWGPGHSSNTSNWPGQKTSNAVAHISYRSMDARAMLESEKRGIVTPMKRAQIEELIQTGYLYPFVNESLEKPVRIPFSIARHYMRSTVPHQFQNQVWALFYSEPALKH